VAVTTPEVARQLRVVELLAGHVQGGLPLGQPRLRGGARLLGVVDRGLWRAAGSEEAALALLAGAGVGELRLGVRDRRRGARHGEFVGLRVDGGDDLAGRDEVAHLDRPRGDPAEDAKAEFHRVACSVVPTRRVEGVRASTSAASFIRKTTSRGPSWARV
jgi:hypothetical protein